MVLVCAAYERGITVLLGVSVVGALVSLLFKNRLVQNPRVIRSYYVLIVLPSEYITLYEVCRSCRTV